ncbi:site-specific recombinase XerD [Lachnotalea glycerini]|uniref:Site-specific recombinase XerD n=1 Tax=Lachnotalea glycerini TaxID=1763509 RepID=A0A318EPS8_9FIRM|nr:site-specific integrase [Lachnotalea glycerini]PXV88373.1 site-specific recombinase XerD [Lachnotalea glycerini]
MAKYKKRKDGRYAANVIVGHDEDGRRIYAPTIYAHSIPELERLKAEIITQVNKGTYANDKGLTVGKWAKDWIVAYKNNVATSTYMNYENIIRNHLNAINDIRLMDLRKIDVQMLINSKSHSSETQRMIKITMNQMLEDAIDDGLVYKNVCRSIKVSKQNESQKRALTDKEKEAIKKCEFTDKEQAFIDILLYTGMRRSEVLALSRKDIDYSNRCISVNKSLSWAGGSHIKDPKTIKSNRQVNMPINLSHSLERYINTIDTLYLFTGQNRTIMSSATFKRFWNDIFNKINCAMGGTPKIIYQNKVTQHGIQVTDLTPHIFRHNYATMLYHGGVDVKEAQRLLGHSSIKVTLEIYTHLMENKTDLTDKLDNIMCI